MFFKSATALALASTALATGPYPYSEECTAATVTTTSTAYTTSTVYAGWKGETGAPVSVVTVTSTYTKEIAPYTVYVTTTVFEAPPGYTYGHSPPVSTPAGPTDATTTGWPAFGRPPPAGSPPPWSSSGDPTWHSESVEPTDPASSWGSWYSESVEPTDPATSWGSWSTGSADPTDPATSWGWSTGSADPTEPTTSWGSGWWSSTLSSVAYPTTLSSLSSLTSVGPSGSGPSCGSPTTGQVGPTNSPNDRQAWSEGFSINTDYSESWPNTGVLCAFEFDITNTTLSYDGTPRLALAINGQVPGPTVECNWGDDIQITVKNSMADNGTAIHWHGIRQLNTNNNDGVPGVTECPIAPGETRVYSFKATQYGSSWYHSHYTTQYGDGIRGPIVINGPASANYDIDLGPLMVDDLFNLTAAQTYDVISHTGPLNAQNYLLNGKNVKPDGSAGEHTLFQLVPGKTHRFRIVNSASQNMWWMHFDDHTMTVIAVDFVPIQPYTTDWLAIAIGQRYDVLITANQPSGNYFIRAVTQLACPGGTTNNGLGTSNGIMQYLGAPLALPTSTYGNRTFGSFATCEDEPLASLIPYVPKGAGTSSAFGATSSVIAAGVPHPVVTTDDGAVFQWFLNGAAINVNWTSPTLENLARGTNASSNVITLTQSKTWVYFVIQNLFLASHPMHLHGHDFSLLGQGLGPFNSSLVQTLNFVNPTRRDTAMLGSAGYTVIGFETDNPGAWLMHCHIVWHVDGGLALQFVETPDLIPTSSYVDSQFIDQCDAYEAFNVNPAYVRTSGESGLKRRNVFGEHADVAGESVVRRSGEHRYFQDYVKRDIGDKHVRRHGLRH